MCVCVVPGAGGQGSFAPYFLIAGAAQLAVRDDIIPHHSLVLVLATLDICESFAFTYLLLALVLQ